jgi:hypothetical protein
MNPAHLHLITTHVPVVGTFLGSGLLVYACLRHSEEVKRTSLLVLVVMALLVLPAYLSGAPAAAMLKRLMLGVSMDATDQHAEVGILALTSSLVLGAASLTGLLMFRRDKKLPGAYVMLMLVLGLLAGGLLAWTANLGGKVRHVEIRGSAAMTPASPPQSTPQG